MKKLLLAIVLSAVLLTSCAKPPSLSDGTGKNADSTTSNPSTSLPDSTAEPVTSLPDSFQDTSVPKDVTVPQASETSQGEPTPEDIAKLYPDKTVLTVSCNTYIYRRDMVRKANEYLSSIGKEYVICVCPVEAEYVKIADSNIGRLDYNSAIEKMADKIDIILSTDYSESVEKGMLLPLDEYIEGSKLRTFIPEKLWNGVRIDGAIYGIDCYSQIGSQRGYFIYCELADKYGFDIEKPPTEQLDTLKVIDEKENCSPVITYNQFFTASYKATLSGASLDRLIGSAAEQYNEWRDHQ